jgi:hypothetical protein
MNVLSHPLAILMLPVPTSLEVLSVVAILAFLEMVSIAVILMSARILMVDAIRPATTP